MIGGPAIQPAPHSRKGKQGVTIFDDHPDNLGQDMRFARFYTRAVEDTEQSQLQGRPVYRNEAFVEIRVRDDPFMVSHVPASEEFRRTWPREWDLYQRAATISAEGCPLEMWPFLRPADISGLKLRGLMTVEQIAALQGDLPDELADLRERAQQYLQPESKTVQQLRAKIAQQAKEIMSLQALLEGARQAAAKAA
jgi:hypothetical protein